MSERDLTIKQRKWLKVYVETGNATEAAMQVYDCKDREIAGTVGCENLTQLQGRFADVMMAAGITPALLAQKLREGLDATAVTRAQKDGRFLDAAEDIDWMTRHRYMDTANKLTGDYAASKHELTGPDGTPLISTTDLIGRFRNGGRPVAEDTPDDGEPQ